MAAVAAAGIVALGVALLATPAHYSPADPASSATLQLGEATENAVARELSRVRPAATDSPPGGYVSDAWDLTFAEEELNAWLGARLPQWLASRDAAMPAGVSSPAVRVEDGRLIIAATYRSLVGEMILSQTLTVEGGSPPRLTPQGLRAGILPVPLDVLPLDRWLEHVAKPIRLEDGRAVEVVSVEATDGTLTVRCRTVKR
jgi:hypothetical protein